MSRTRPEFFPANTKGPEVIPRQRDEMPFPWAGDIARIMENPFVDHIVVLAENQALGRLQGQRKIEERTRPASRSEE